MEEGQSLDLGPFKGLKCSGQFYKQADNHLYVSMRIASCGDINARIPLSDREYGEHILDIRWEAEQVHLRLGRRLEVAIAW